MKKIIPILLVLIPAILGAQGTITGAGTISGAGYVIGPTAPVGCGGAGQLPCATGWYQIPNTSAIALCNAATPAQSGSCAAVITAWNSGAADTTRNRLWWTGGGHTDYSGNQWFYLDLFTQTVHMANNPDPVNASCVDTDPSGNPQQVHTYGGLGYIASTDQLFRHGGALYPCGNGTNADWTFSPATLTWHRNDPLSGTTQTGDCCNYQTAGDYDPVGDLYYYIDDAFLWSRNLHTNTQTQVSNLPFELFPNQDDNCVIAYNPDRLMVCMGNGIVATASLTAATPTFTQTTTTGCGTMSSPLYPALAFDPVQDLIVNWQGGNTVYTYNTATKTCSSVTFTGGPPAVSGNGVFGRFRYFPALGGFALVNDMSQNAYFLRMTPFQANLNNFMQRASAPGVIVFQGFDGSGIPHATNSGGITSGAQVANNGTSYPSQDTVNFASGVGSLRFDIPTPTGTANPSGYWTTLYQAALNGTPATAKVFGPGTTFYVQYRQMMTAAYISNTWGGSFFKQAIISPDQYTCGSMEFTTVNSFSKGFPEAYYDCGAVGLAINLNNGDYLLEQGSTIGGTTIGSGGNYNCHYQGTNGPPNLCFLYPAMTWVTYTYQVTVGTSGTASTNYLAWVTTGGQSYTGHQWLNMIGNNVTFDEPGYDMLTLLPYWTGGYTGASGPATTWYDEVIVSSQPIAAPNN